MESLPTLTKTKLRFTWSKWGGTKPRTDYSTKDLNEWFCQSCGETQSWEMDSYLIPIDETGLEFVRICAKCKNKMVLRRFVYSFQLIETFRTD